MFDIIAFNKECNGIRSKPLLNWDHNQSVAGITIQAHIMAYNSAKTYTQFLTSKIFKLSREDSTRSAACRICCSNQHGGKLKLKQCFLTFAFTLFILNVKWITAAPNHRNNNTTNTNTKVLPVEIPIHLNSSNSSGLLLSNLKQALLQENDTAQFENKPVFLLPSIQGSSRTLKRVFLSNRSVVCNDGTAAGFYLRKSLNSKKWIIFLEGGWHCYDSKTCRSRWTRLRHLMTSSQWPETRDVGGILSSNPDENPYWHNANHVLVPYCSSDSWSGTRSQPDLPDLNFRFMGALILRQVISDLIPLGLGRSVGAELLLIGSSAGGLGVMLHLDRIANYLQNERQLQIAVRGVSDSGWFLDREPYTPSDIASSEAVRHGWSMWKGSLPETCVEHHKLEPWRCYFGYRLYPTLKAPLFVFQWLFDEAQMRADNVAAPVTPHQWNYIHAMGGALRTSLDNVTAVFAPSCIGHAVLSKREWLTIKIDNISLPKAIHCWEQSNRLRCNRRHKWKHSLETSTHNTHNSSKKRKVRNQKQQNNNAHNMKKNLIKLAKREERKRTRHRSLAQREEKRFFLKNNTSFHHNNAFGLVRRNGKSLKNCLHNMKNGQYIKRQRKLKYLDQYENNKKKHLEDEQPPIKLKNRLRMLNKVNRHDIKSEECTLRLLERCSWPQCNHSCPTLTNPATGEEMRFLELLASFGLDIEAVATALGVDMHTLKNMDRTELVNLLTQQVN